MGEHNFFFLEGGGGGGTSEKKTPEAQLSQYLDVLKSHAMSRSSSFWFHMIQIYCFIELLD